LRAISLETQSDIQEEIERLIDESDNKNYKIGQSLYVQLPLFCNPSDVIPDWCWEMIQDYYTTTEYNIPLANSLDDVNSWMLDCFNIIKEEISNINIYRNKKNGS